MGKPAIIDLKHLNVNQGNITVAEDREHLPFKLNRVYWLTDISEGQVRGNNASLVGQRVIACLHGHITVTLEDVKGNHYHYELSDPHHGLYIPSLHWTKIKFIESSILVCLASNRFEESDYIRSHQEFLALPHD